MPTPPAYTILMREARLFEDAEKAYYLATAVQALTGIPVAVSAIAT